MSTVPTPNPWVMASSDEYGAQAAVTIPYRPDPPAHPADLVFEGPCPRCDHAFVYRWPLEVVRGLSTTTVTVSCQCKHAHPGEAREGRRLRRVLERRRARSMSFL